MVLSVPSWPPATRRRGTKAVNAAPTIHTCTGWKTSAPRAHVHPSVTLSAGWVTAVSAQGTEYLRGGRGFVRPNPSGGEEEEEAGEALGTASVEDAEGEEGEEEEEEEEELDEADDAVATADATTEGAAHAAIDVS